MRISDWSSDVCSSDLRVVAPEDGNDRARRIGDEPEKGRLIDRDAIEPLAVEILDDPAQPDRQVLRRGPQERCVQPLGNHARSEEHTSELQSLMSISDAVLCLNKKKQTR